MEESDVFGNRMRNRRSKWRQGLRILHMKLMVEKFIGFKQNVNYLEPSSVCSTRKGRSNFCYYVYSFTDL